MFLVQLLMNVQLPRDTKKAVKKAKTSKSANILRNIVLVKRIHWIVDCSEKHCDFSLSQTDWWKTLCFCIQTKQDKTTQRLFSLPITTITLVRPHRALSTNKLVNISELRNKDLSHFSNWLTGFSAMFHGSSNLGTSQASRETKKKWRED